MFLGYVLYVICLCVLYWGGVLFYVVYGVGVLGAICLYYVVLAFIFLMSWDFQGLLHINSFTCVLRVWIICDKSIFIILRCCFVMCCVWSRCLVSYLSLWWCICIYICGFIGCWKDLCILFSRGYMCIPSLVESCEPGVCLYKLGCFCYFLIMAIRYQCLNKPTPCIQRKIYLYMMSKD